MIEMEKEDSIMSRLPNPPCLRGVFEGPGGVRQEGALWRVYPREASLTRRAPGDQCSLSFCLPLSLSTTNLRLWLCKHG